MFYKNISSKICSIFILAILMMFINYSISLADENTWSPTSPMNIARSGHTATKLKNGKVLVAGGGSTKAELFDPKTGEWTFTGTMAQDRTNHVAVLLNDGNVLVIAGDSDSSQSVELYNTDNGIWTSAESTINPHSAYFIGIKLQNGKILVAGGVNTTAAEFYDPATKEWFPTRPMTTIRNPGGVKPAATLLQDGQVLVAGGYNSYPLNSAELYDPTTGEWTITGSMSAAREIGHSLTLMDDGKVIVTGGYGPPLLSSVESYDPDTETWTELASMNFKRSGHIAAEFGGGQLLVAAGTIDNNVPIKSSELYNPSTQWIEAASINDARYFHTITKLDTDQILITGGINSNGDPLASAELYGDNIPPASIVISGGSDKIAVKEETARFTAIGKNSDGDIMHDLNFIWTTGDSGDTGKATIDANGIATGIEPGVVTVNALSRGVSGTATLIVLGDLDSIIVDDGSKEVRCERETHPFTAKGLDSNGYTIPDINFIWTTGEAGDTGIASIGSESGIATGVEVGSVTVLAISDDVVGTTTIKVIEKKYFWIDPAIKVGGIIVGVGTAAVGVYKWHKKHDAKQLRKAKENLLEVTATTKLLASSVSKSISDALSSSDSDPETGASLNKVVENIDTISEILSGSNTSSEIGSSD